MLKTVAFAVAVACASSALAAEHPKEHPTGAEHPAGHEHPAGSKHWTKQMTQEYTKAVEDFVARSPGGLKVHDDKLGKDWTLELVGVHKKRVVHLGDNRFFACADFKSLDSKDKLDLDFYASKDGAAWKVEPAVIHKVNGKARYTYNDKNEMVPTGQEGSAQKASQPYPMKDMGSR